MPRFAHVHDLVPAELPDVPELAGFCIAVVPFALAALEYRMPKYVWAEDSYLRGTQLIRGLQMALLCGGLQQITDRQDALYRMVDSALFGTVYSVVETEPLLIVAPEIPPVHDLTIIDPLSMIGRMDDMSQLLQNALNGTDTPNYSDTPGIRQLIADLIAAIEAGEANDEEMLANLVQIAGLLV